MQDNFRPFQPRLLQNSLIDILVKIPSDGPKISARCYYSKTGGGSGGGGETVMTKAIAKAAGAVKSIALDHCGVEESKDYQTTHR